MFLGIEGRFLLLRHQGTQLGEGGLKERRELGWLRINYELEEIADESHNCLFNTYAVNWIRP